MNKTTSILFLFLLGIISCKSDKRETSNREIQKTETNNKKIPPTEIKLEKPTIKEELLIDKALNNQDTLNTFIVDDYPIEDEMFKDSYEPIKSGALVSYDRAWFSNDELQQTLVFELYTDYHRLITYHFDNANIPNDLIKNMNLHLSNGDMAPISLKEKEFPGMLQKSTTIDKHHFTSNKGISIGDDKEHIIAIYGKSDQIMNKAGIEILEWLFLGDQLYKEKTEQSIKPIAANSFGHQITMYFKENKLVGQILFNDIP